MTLKEKSFIETVCRAVLSDQSRKNNLKRMKRSIYLITETKRWNFFDQSVQSNGCELVWEPIKKSKNNSGCFHQSFYLMYRRNLFDHTHTYNRARPNENETPKIRNNFPYIFHFYSFLSVFHHRHRYRCCCCCRHYRKKICVL